MHLLVGTQPILVLPQCLSPKELSLRKLFAAVELGLFITEALHPFNVFRSANFDVDLVSETGSYQPDWLSQTEDWLKGDDRITWENPDSGFRGKLDGLMQPKNVRAEDVGSVGHKGLRLLDG
ncbi:MAG: hypothetical protein M1834_002485 [Cirrosporium novae-zelandiae]|nr:MAG: hypothetical protein M1834_002485 [Cirrosporium novae-zelandiae]